MVTVFGVIAPPGGDGRALSHPLLLWGARALWGLEELPPFARGENGKPFFPSAPHLQFNLSHSGAVALCAFSTRGSVGVDVEKIRPRNPALPRRVLHPLEYAAYEAAGVPLPADLEEYSTRSGVTNSVPEGTQFTYDDQGNYFAQFTQEDGQICYYVLLKGTDAYGRVSLTAPEEVFDAETAALWLSGSQLV